MRANFGKKYAPQKARFGRFICPVVFTIGRAKCAKNSFKSLTPTLDKSFQKPP